MSHAYQSILDVDPMHDFSMGNLPYGVFDHGRSRSHIGVAIGENILDLHILTLRGLFPSELFQDAFLASNLNPFLYLGFTAWTRARNIIKRLLGTERPNLADYPELAETALVPREDARMTLPVEIPDYTDFYASEEHARNVGSIFRGPENALHPNWRHVPIGYHGRASSIVVSGTDVVRPTGQIMRSGKPVPAFMPTQKLDFELEVGWIVGKGNALGATIHVDSANEHIFGMVLVNDWSARDIQQWEYVPLGPFLGKSFQTSISPWVVPMEALAETRCPAPQQHPEPLPYLRERNRFQSDVDLFIELRPNNRSEYSRICTSNLRHLYWTPIQMLAHHASNGCNMRPGDLFASGTISAPTTEGKASLLEITENGSIPLQVDGLSRTFLEDGDEVRISGRAQTPSYGIGLGEVSGRILPARNVSRFSASD